MAKFHHCPTTHSNTGLEVKLAGSCPCCLASTSVSNVIAVSSEAAKRASSVMSSVQLRVLFSYAGTEQDECNLNEGDIVEGFSEVSGWWRGKSQGKVGIFPANYVEVVEASASPPLPPKSAPASSAAAAGAQASGSSGGGATDDTWDAKELRTMNGNPMLRRGVAGRSAPSQPDGVGAPMSMQANPGAPAVGDLETGGAAAPGNAESGGA